MIRVPLSGRRGAGLFTLIDDDDLVIVDRHRWSLITAPRSLTAYARCSVNGRGVLLHRLLMSPPEGLVVDHIDGNGLNNQRANLRVVTQSENMRAILPRRMFDLFEKEL